MSGLQTWRTKIELRANGRACLGRELLDQGMSIGLNGLGDRGPCCFARADDHPAGGATPIRARTFCSGTAFPVFVSAFSTFRPAAAPAGTAAGGGAGAWASTKAEAKIAAIKPLAARGAKDPLVEEPDTVRSH